MSNNFINDITSSLQKNGKSELANKWSKLAQEAGYNLYNPNPQIENFSRITGPDNAMQEPKKVQHSYQVTIEGPADMDDIEIMNSINKSVNEISGVTVKGYQFLFKKEI
jgi:hypothetical protein